MKRLLTGLLTIISISSFADICTVVGEEHQYTIEINGQSLKINSHAQKVIEQEMSHIAHLDSMEEKYKKAFYYGVLDGRGVMMFLGKKAAGKAIRSLILARSCTYSESANTFIKNEWINYVEKECIKISPYYNEGISRLYESDDYTNCKELYYGDRTAWNAFLSH